MNQIISTSIEQKLLEEIAEVDRKIVALQQERVVFERLLFKALISDSGSSKINRKNAIDRIIIENTIIERLKMSGTNTVRSSEILRHVRLIHSKINESTFRSHLHRMKKRGLIISSGSAGWRLSSPNILDL